MNFLYKAFDRLEELPENTVKKAFILFCSGVFLTAFLYIYKARYEQTTLIDQAKTTIKNEVRINELLAKKIQIDLEKNTTNKLFEGYQKDLLQIIEASAKEAEVDLGDSHKSSFKQIPIPQEADFVEQQATIFLDKVNLKKIITMINSLRNENFVMFRELKIENKGSSPSCQILLSMRQNK